VQDPAAAAVAEAAVREADAFDAIVRIERDVPLPEVDAALTGDGIRAQEEPDEELISILQGPTNASGRQRRCGRPGSTTRPRRAR